MRDSFILYTEQKEIINKLSDEQAGKLIKAIYEYEATGMMPELEKEIDLAITSIKQTLDKNEEKWKEIRQQRAEAGRLGGIKRAINQGQELSSKSKQSQAKLSKAKQNQANQAVNVNVNVNDIIKENIKRKKFTPPTLEEVNLYIKEKQLKVDGQKFFEYFTEGGWKDSKGNQVKNWKQKLLTWNRYVEKSGSNISNNSNKRNYEDYSKFYANN